MDDVTTVSPAILGLLKCMPPGGRAGFSTWSKEGKEKWMAALRAILDLEYPDTQQPVTSRDDHE